MTTHGWHVVRTEDEVQLETSRFCNVIGNQRWSGSAHEVRGLLNQGQSIEITNSLERETIRGFDDWFDWQGCWTLDKYFTPTSFRFEKPESTDDLHECEKRIPGFNNPDASAIQKELGPVFLRYSDWHGPMYRHSDRNWRSRSNEYIAALNWTGGNTGSNHPATAFQERKVLIEDLTKKILEFTDDYEVPNELPILVISPPKGSSGLTKEQHKNHLGFIIASHIAARIKTKFSNTNQLMAFNMFQNLFPQVGSGGSWEEKAQNKQGQWRDEVSTEARQSIQKAELIIIADDTMISYSSMLRIAMTVRNINPNCGILCAAVFALTGRKDGEYVNDSPESLYEILKDAVDNQEGD